jgi:hypothetical protein
MPLNSIEWSILTALEYELSHVQVHIHKEEDMFGPNLPYLETSYIIEQYLKGRIAELRKEKAKTIAEYTMRDD